MKKIETQKKNIRNDLLKIVSNWNDSEWKGGKNYRKLLDSKIEWKNAELLLYWVMGRCDTAIRPWRVMCVNALASTMGYYCDSKKVHALMVLTMPTSVAKKIKSFCNGLAKVAENDVVKQDCKELCDFLTEFYSKPVQQRFAEIDDMEWRLAIN